MIFFCVTDFISYLFCQSSLCTLISLLSKFLTPIISVVKAQIDSYSVSTSWFPVTLPSLHEEGFYYCVDVIL